MNRNQAVSSLKEILSGYSYLFPNSYSIERIDEANYKIHLKANQADIQLLRSVAKERGYTIKDEDQGIEIT